MAVYDISAAFHKRLLLLTDVIPPNDDFKKYFKEGMFNRPNTAGFIHVSYYLLNIYNEKSFQSSILWPLTSREDETKYRNAVKNYMTNIAKEHPDVGFPNILLSHLLQAGGTKFKIIMYKLSEVVVRKFLAQDCEKSILSHPKCGITNKLTLLYMKNTVTHSNTEVQKLKKEMNEVVTIVTSTIMEESSGMKEKKNEILKIEQNIKALVAEAPVHETIKKQLTNIKDSEVINSWTSNINETLKYLKHKNAELQNREQLINHIMGIISHRYNNKGIFDGKQHKIVNLSSDLVLSQNIIDTNSQIYENDILVLHKFFYLFKLLLQHVYNYLSIKQIEDVTVCLPQIEASNSDIRSILKLLNELLTNIQKDSELLKNNFDLKNQKNLNFSFDWGKSENICLLRSPQIKISVDCDTEVYQLQKQLQITPVQATHNTLFSRYKKRDSTTPRKLQKLKNLSVTRLNIDENNSLSNVSTSSRTRVVLQPSTTRTLLNNDVYSRLFSSRKIANRGDCSVISLSRAQANSTALEKTLQFDSPPVKNSAKMIPMFEKLVKGESCHESMPEIQKPKILTIDDSTEYRLTTVKTIRHSREFKDEMEKCIIETNESLFTCELIEKITLDSIDEFEISDIHENFVDDKTTNNVEKKSRRLSINDLVTQYKHLIDTSNLKSNLNSCEKSTTGC